MRRLSALATLIVLGSAGCRSDSSRPANQTIESFGLVESPVDHPALLSSIQIAQLILGPASRTPVVAGWTASKNTTAIRVFAATPHGFAKSEVMNSYQTCNCIVARIGAITDWLSSHQGAADSLLAVDNQNVLAYMLLHETGHIIHGDLLDKEGSSRNASPTTSFNLDATLQKDREIAADRYASEAIAQAMSERGTDRGIAATAVALSLSQLSWNLARHRIVDSFGGTTLHESSLFWDVGLSHPNLEWRILSANDTINSTPESHQLLTDFESSRRPHSPVLFRAPTH